MTDNYVAKEFTIEDYRTFMYNPDNAYKCDKCPENNNMKSPASEIRHPCGQYNCWVICHCK